MTVDKPLNVRCAAALGWECRNRPRASGRWEGIPPGGSWAWGSETVPPYGEDTPAGWACTGPLIGRYGLLVSFPMRGIDRWDCCDASCRLAHGPNPCAAVAEWVAGHVEGGEVKP